MRGTAAVLPTLALLALLALLPASLQAQSYDDLAGGWVVASWTTPEGQVNDRPQPGLFLFTATGQYSMMYVTGDEPRSALSEDSDDAAVLSAMNAFTANSGRYRIDGSQLTYEAFVAKNPNYMAGWDPDTGGNAQTVTMSMSDGMLTLTWANGRKASLRRPAGLEGGG